MPREVPYDYKALYKHLLTLNEAAKLPKVSNQEIRRASEALSDLEFEVWKAFNLTDKRVTAQDVLGDLVANGSSNADSLNTVRMICYKIRRKGFDVRTYARKKPVASKRQMTILKAIADGVDRADIRDRLQSANKNINIVALQLRRKYPQFHLGNVAKTRT